jgi:hypothetical protein
MGIQNPAITNAMKKIKNSLTLETGASPVETTVVLLLF